MILLAQADKVRCCYYQRQLARHTITGDLHIKYRDMEVYSSVPITVNCPHCYKANLCGQVLMPIRTLERVVGLRISKPPPSKPLQEMA